jgi:plasmid stability protein
MRSVTVRNLPDEIHRALRVRAAHHGRSTEAEIRNILETAVRPPERVKLGSLLSRIGREVGLTKEDCAAFDQVRDKIAGEPVSFE